MGGNVLRIMESTGRPHFLLPGSTPAPLLSETFRLRPHLPSPVRLPSQRAYTPSHLREGSELQHIKGKVVQLCWEDEIAGSGTFWESREPLPS